MTAQTLEINGVRVLELAAEGPKVRNATDLISLVFEHDVSLVAIPAGRLDEDFFKLSTGVAGEIVQKFANYRLRLAILGDISAHVAQSNALRGFVVEANRNHQLWFLEDLEALAARLR
jgi:hypothetical protein